MSSTTDRSFRHLLDLFAMAGGTRIPSGMDFKEACRWLDEKSGIHCKLPFGILVPVEGIIDIPHVIMNGTKSHLWSQLDENPNALLLVQGSRRRDAAAYWTVSSFDCVDQMLKWIESVNMGQFNLVAGSMYDSAHRCVAALSLDSWPIKTE